MESKQIQEWRSTIVGKQLRLQYAASVNKHNEYYFFFIDMSKLNGNKVNFEEP